MEKNRRMPFLPVFLCMSFLLLLFGCGGSGGGSGSGGGNGGGGGGNTAPIANAGVDQLVATGEAVTLDGTGSTDADSGDVLSYSWTFTSNPGGDTLTGADTDSPEFTPTADGAYVLSLVVNDGTVDSAPDTVTITASSAGFYSLGGVVSGFAVDGFGYVFNGITSTVTFTDATAGDQAVITDGQFAFSTQLEDSTVYDVTVKSHPSGQYCKVLSGGSGTISGADVTDITVLCMPDTSDYGMGLFLSSNINAISQDALSSTGSGNVVGVNYSYDILGIAFCTPSNPYMTMPYDCTNDATVTIDVNNPIATTAAVQLTLSSLYIDASITRDKTPLCGEFIAGTVTEDAYVLLDDLVVDIELGLQNTPEGFKVADSITQNASVSSFSASALGSNDACLTTYSGQLKTALIPKIETTIEEFVDDHFLTLIGTMPAFSNTP